MHQAAIFDAMPVCVAMLDSRGVIVSINKPWRCWQ